MIPRILVVNDSRDRRFAGLAAALRRRGAFVATTSLASIAFDSNQPSGLMIPGFSGDLPDAVLVRSIAAGSFEVITRRLGILHALAKLAVPVWNSAQAIERCVDKSMTTFLLKSAGLPIPPTFAVEGRAEAERLVERELRRAALVVKPLFGAQGHGIRLVRALSDLPGEDEVSGVYYLQHYVPRAGPPYRDYRVFVCAGIVTAMMCRRGDDWVTNVNRGAVPEAVSGHRESALAELAVAAAAAVGAQFAGVDIVAAEDGRLHVLEVNSMPAWSGLQSVAAVNIADTIAAALLGFLAASADKAAPDRTASLRRRIPDMQPTRDEIRAAYENACRLEIEALKPGNVHRFAGGHGMSAEEFITSARISSGPLTEPGRPVGQRILEAVRATRGAVATNTNLGIILLCAPLACAAELPGNLRDNLAGVLDSLSIEDAQAAFTGIVLAAPGGLGSSETQDVRQAPTVHLLEAMRLAAGRDRVARQYATCFQDVFELGLPAFDAAVAGGERGMWPTVFLYMTFLAAFPDSHVARRHGEEAAGRLRLEAAAVRAALDAAGYETERMGLLMEFDRKLKQRAFNPGTSADLTVASLLTASLLVHLRGDGLHSGNVDG